MEYDFLSVRRPINPDRVTSYCRGHDDKSPLCQYIVVGTEDGIGERIRVVIPPKKVKVKGPGRKKGRKDPDLIDCLVD